MTIDGAQLHQARHPENGAQLAAWHDGQLYSKELLTCARQPLQQPPVEVGSAVLGRRLQRGTAHRNSATGCWLIQVVCPNLLETLGSTKCMHRHNANTALRAGCPARAHSPVVRGPINITARFFSRASAA